MKEEGENAFEAIELNQEENKQQKLVQDTSK